MGNSPCGGASGFVPTTIASDKHIDINGLIVRAQARAFPFEIEHEEADADGPLEDASAASVAVRTRSTTRSRVSVVTGSVSVLGKYGGECFLLVERCHNVPCSAASSSLSALNCGAPQNHKGGKPYVCAWAQGRDGVLLGRRAEWPVRSNTKSPTWFSARPLGISISKAPDAVLRMELWNDASLLGSLTTPLGDLPGHTDLTREFDMEGNAGKVDDPCSVTFQVLDTRAVHAGRRVVYFVRHGESLWNAAQSKANLHEMARTLDHPLSLKGRMQAEALREKIAEGMERGDPHAQDMSMPGVMYVSPLCRAIQTAIIGLGPSQVATGGEMVLMAAAREKQNLGGLDSMSTKRGEEILHSTLEELTKIYSTSPDGQQEAVDLFGKLRFDVHEAQEQWWCEGNSDSAEQLRCRLQDFMAQLLYTPHQTAVVVGHSHFFRSAFRAFLAKEFSDQDPLMAKDIASKKLMNCGVARVELDPRRGVEGGPIVGVELVLGTTLDADGGAAILSACCNAPGHTEEIGPHGNTLMVEDRGQPPEKYGADGGKGSTNHAL